MKDLPEKKRYNILSIVVLAVVSGSAAYADLIDPAAPSLAAAAAGGIQQVSAVGRMVGGNWVETVTLKNNGTTDANGLIITSWPYNDKDLVDPDNDKGPRKDSATPAEPGAQFAQQKVVPNIPPGGTAVVTFTYTGVDAKPWESYYFDVYAGRINITNRVLGTAAFYAFVPIAPGQGGAFAFDFQRPYPAALIGSDIFGPAEFAVEITNLSLPPGWSLADFGPLAYTLAADGSAPFFTLMHASFITANTIFPGETAFLDYDALLVGTDQHWQGQMGIQVVPEPSLTLAMAVIFGGLWLWRISGINRYRQGRA